MNCLLGRWFTLNINLLSLKNKTEFCLLQILLDALMVKQSLFFSFSQVLALSRVWLLILQTYLLQLIITSSGWVLLFNIPCLGWSPLPRNNPGGSILKLPIFSLCPSIVQKPYSSNRAAFSSLRACEQFVFNPLLTEWIPPHHILEDSDFDFRSVRLCGLDFCFAWGFTAQSTQWGHVEHSQFT